MQIEFIIPNASVLSSASSYIPGFTSVFTFDDYIRVYINGVTNDSDVIQIVSKMLF